MVINIDGPPVDVVVSGQIIVRLSCGTEGFDMTTVPGLSLPWRLELRRLDGSILADFAVESVDPPKMVIVRGESAVEGPYPRPAGPIPQSPCPT